MAITLTKRNLSLILIGTVLIITVLILTLRTEPELTAEERRIQKQVEEFNKQVGPLELEEPFVGPNQGVTTTPEAF